MGLLSDGAFVRWDYCPLGLLSAGTIVRWDYCPLGLLYAGTIVRWDFCPTHYFITDFKISCEFVMQHCERLFEYTRNKVVD